MFLRGCVAFFVISWPTVAGNISYVVLHRYGPDSLVRVSDDGQSRTTIASGAGGYGLAVDQHGDYIVAAVSALLRVTPSGFVSNIAVAPTGSQWLGVAVDSEGNYVVADNQRHSIWRISEDGRRADRIATYPVHHIDEMEDVGIIVDGAGDYLVVEDNHFTVHFWRVSAAGGVTSIPLHGDKMMSSSSIVTDVDGTYLVVSYRDHAIFRVTPTGEVTKFANIDGQKITSLARNPETGELVATSSSDPVLRKISANGSSVTNFTDLGPAYAIIAETGR